MLVYKTIVELADTKPDDGIVMLYFDRINTYFKIATNDCYTFDQRKLMTTIPYSFFPSVRISSKERYPVGAERFPFAVNVELKTNTAFFVVIKFNLLPTLILYLINIFAAVVFALITVDGNYNQALSGVIPFFFAAISIITFLITYYRARSIKNNLLKLYNTFS